jgi:hypothetical protein
MIPTSAILAEMGTLLGADTTTMAQVAPFVGVALVMSPFVPSPQRVLADLTLATFNGSTPLQAASAATQVFNDGATGDRIMQVRAPAGGWHWVTGSALNLPQTIFGFALLDNAAAVLFGCQLFDVPFVLTAAGQAVDIGDVFFRLLAAGVI